MIFAKIEKWHNTFFGLIGFGLTELGLAYLFASLAIPSAHTWEWALAAVFGLGAIHNAGLLIIKIIHDIKASKASQN